MTEDESMLHPPRPQSRFLNEICTYLLRASHARYSKGLMAARSISFAPPRGMPHDVCVGPSSRNKENHPAQFLSAPFLNEDVRVAARAEVVRGPADCGGGRDSGRGGGRGLGEGDACGEGQLERLPLGPDAPHELVAFPVNGHTPRRRVALRHRDCAAVEKAAGCRVPGARRTARPPTNKEHGGCQMKKKRKKEAPGWPSSTLHRRAAEVWQPSKLALRCARAWRADQRRTKHGQPDGSC